MRDLRLPALLYAGFLAALLGCQSGEPEPENAPAETPAPVATPAPTASPAPESMRINITHEEQDLADLVEQIGARVGRTILVDPDVSETVSINLPSLPWRELIDVLAKMTRCEVEERPDGVIVLSQPAIFTIQGHSTPEGLLHAVARFADRSGVVVPKGFPQHKANLHVSLPWRDAFQKVLDDLEGSYLVEDWDADPIVVIRR